MLKVRNLNISFGKKEIISDVSFQLKPHTVNILLGKNASGKSTILSAINSTVKYKGKISWGDNDLALMEKREKARIISFLPQQLQSVCLTVEDVVKMGRNPYLDFGKRLADSDKEQIEKAISIFGLEKIRHKYLTQISGGERQKVYLAMIFAQNTNLVILDEPTTYMDTENEKEFAEIIKQLRDRHKKTLLVVMHDLTRSIELGDNIMILNGGKLVFNGERNLCLEEKAIEKNFSVKRYTYESEEGEKILFR